MYDLKIVNGDVVDGTGSPRRRVDIAVKDGRIVRVGEGLTGDAVETIDATGTIVTPGFVDCHTHYDGQVTWDEALEPSACHGVTTIVMGNCGVGFAPVVPGREDWLIQLMEGVEDIPGTALSEGMTWGWESFPEYLDALAERRFGIDVATQIAHGPLRAYVMGDAGANNKPASATDIGAMARLVREALEAGAVGFSTSRTTGHRAMSGEPVPGTFAAEAELFGIAREMAKVGRAVFELAPAGIAGEDLLAPGREIDWMRRLSIDTGLPVSFGMLQFDQAPTMWRELLAESLRARDEGAELYPQVAGRAFGMMVGWQTRHAFSGRASYKQLEASTESFASLVAALRDPANRARILADVDPPTRAVPFDGTRRLVQTSLHKLFPVEGSVDYEPTSDRSVLARATALGLDPLAHLYDLMCADDGHALFLLPLFGYADGNLDSVREMLTHPTSVSGLGDGGAHCRLICDASIPTFMLTHWARDRTRGEQLPLEWVVRKQTRDPAELFGLSDRGVIAPGKRADLNVIDHRNLRLHAPRMAHDLPAGGGRLLQDASGYVATIVDGVIVRRDDAPTGARPGRLVRAAR
jgi:N-acyl-D-amino-acid deacylase